MRLDRSYGSSGISPAELDSEADFNKHAVAELASLAELRKAPLVEEEYHGPLLFSADAAADTLRSLLGAAVTATRPALGTEARTNGAFASSYHARVLPDFMNVVDDPSLKTFNGKALLGAYDVDDEGVPAQAVKLVDEGRLDNYLIGRQPVRDFPQSNGHGRAGITGPARPMIGVLKITADNGLSTDELNKKLLDMAKDRGLQASTLSKPWAQSVSRVCFTASAPTASANWCAAQCLMTLTTALFAPALTPRERISGSPTRLGTRPPPSSPPRCFFSDATVRRANAKNDKLPFYPPPIRYMLSVTGPDRQGRLSTTHFLYPHLTL